MVFHKHVPVPGPYSFSVIFQTLAGFSAKQGFIFSQILVTLPHMEEGGLVNIEQTVVEWACS